MCGNDDWSIKITNRVIDTENIIIKYLKLKLLSRRIELHLYAAIITLTDMRQGRSYLSFHLGR